MRLDLSVQVKHTDILILYARNIYIFTEKMVSQNVADFVTQILLSNILPQTDALMIYLIIFTGSHVVLSIFLLVAFTENSLEII